MKKLFFFLLFSIVYAANLINVNFFESKNKLDILLSLDNKFDGKVIKLDKYDYLVKNVIANKVIEKKFNNYFVKEVKILPRNDGVILKVLSNKDFKVSVALTPEKYGLRFRISSFEVIQKKLPTFHKESFSFVRYFIVVAILIFLAIILLLLKKKINSNLPVKSEMKVLSQKFIDAKNKVVLFEFQKKKYLMLIGNTNLLLDVFDENFKAPKNETEFEEMLKLHNKIDEIEKYIQKADNIKELDERI
jgi:flagellar biogenesis protein FliO